MAKPTITKRVTKGAALTYSELDTNFQNLADATITLTAGSGGTAVTADLNGTITLVAGTNVTITGDNSAKTITINSSGGGGGGGITDIIQDTSPQLGGNLDLNNFLINNSAGNDITLAMNSAGSLIIGTSSLTGNAIIKSNGTNSSLVLATSHGLSGPYIGIVGNATTSNIAINTVSGGSLQFSSNMTANSPVDGNTRTGWLKIILSGGGARYIPLYT